MVTKKGQARQSGAPEEAAQSWPSRSQQLDRVIIRFAGDSGDGMQLTGDRFTSETAAFGNDLSTLPDFPAEIRAPAGTLPGVSAFQLHFADHDIMTPGDAPDVLVAMNPAALKANLADLPAGADIIVNTDEFTKRNLTKVGYASNPLEDGSLEPYHVHPVALTSMTVEALKSFDITKKEAERAKNMFALGLLSLALPPPDRGHVALPRRRSSPASPRSCRPTSPRSRPAGRFGETTEDFAVSYEVKPATLPPGTYRNITGNLALSYGLVAASQALRAAAVPRLLPDHAGLGHPARAERSTSASACAPSRPRTRSPASAPRSARRSAARSASPRPPARAWRSRARRSGWPSRWSCR